MRATSVIAALALASLLSGCKPRGVPEAEAKKDVAWLGRDASPEAIGALGRLADKDPRAVSELETRAATDVNAYIAAWLAVARNAPWGSTFFRNALADPLRAELAISAMPRRDARLTPFTADLEGAIVRLGAGKSGSVIAGLLATIGPTAHDAVQRRLVDVKTRGAMCDGIGLQDASGDAKSLLLSVPPEARDQSSCVAVVLEMAASENVVVEWLGRSAEPGLLTTAAKSSLACPRIAIIWQKALVERAAETHTALSVPLGLSIRRCASALDDVLADLLEKAPRSRSCILHGIDPYSADLGDMKHTCRALTKGWAAGESALVRERANDALTHGCRFVR